MITWQMIAPEIQINQWLPESLSWPSALGVPEDKPDSVEAK